jgi:hypothetical protein
MKPHFWTRLHLISELCELNAICKNRFLIILLCSFYIVRTDLFFIFQKRSHRVVLESSQKNLLMNYF